MYIAAYVWFALMVIFLIAEGACPFHLVSIWFAIGALAAAVVSLMSGAVWLQIVVFIGVSGLLLAALWPLVRKVLNPHQTKTNIDALIGSRGYVITTIDNLKAEGQVKLGAMEWSARSTSGAPIPVGTLVQVDRIEGVKVLVTEVKVTTNV